MKSDSIQVRASAKRSEDHHYPHLTGYEIRYFYEVFPSLNETDLCVMMGLTAFAFGGVETTPTRGALATFVQGKTLESRKLKITRSLRRMETAGAIEIFEQDGKANIYDITLFNARTFDYAKAQGWFDSIKFQPTLIRNDNTPLSDLITLKNKQEDGTGNTNTMQTPVLQTVVASESDIDSMVGVSEQLSELSLTNAQRKVLSRWLVEHFNTEQDYAEYDGAKRAVMNNLVQKGYLAEKDGLYSTKLQDHEYSILFSLTYEQLGETPPAGKKPTHKPFWEAVANMYCWNDNNCSWADYVAVCTDKELSQLNGKIKSTCLELDSYHEDNPFTVAELRWIFEHWFNTKFKDLRAKDRKFPVSKDAIRNNMASLRVGYKLYLKNQQSSEDSDDA